MSLKRILKLLFAFLTGQGVSLVSQLLIPPLFIHRYASGMEVYGEWIALSAAVAYLSNLNFGVQNYANNQTTLLYSGGKVQEAKAVQSSAICLILMIVGVLSLIGVAFLFLPVAGWLGIRHISSFDTSLTMFLLVLQLGTNMLFAFLANSYQVIGALHRGQIWQSAQRLAAALVISAFIWVRASFPVLAATQVITGLLFTALTLVDMRRQAPILLPSLRFGTRKLMISMLTPSAHFGLMSVSTFLIWQGPVLVIQKILGPASVAVFSLSRTIFSMSRQILVVATYAIGQDITRLVGQKNWQQLRRLYDLSEKVVLFLVPISTLGTLLVCPLLFSVWLHHRSIYEPATCLLMAVISAVIGIKEHKWQFQWSSNQHESLARFNLVSCVLMLAASALLIGRFGVIAFLFCWLASEVTIFLYIVHLNGKLFPADIHLSVAPLWRLAALLSVAFTLAAWPVWKSPSWSLWTVTAVALSFTAVLAVASYFIFGLDEVRAVFKRKMLSRHAAASEA